MENASSRTRTAFPGRGPDIWARHAVPLLAFPFLTKLFWLHVTNPRHYLTDIWAHLEIARTGQGYSLLYTALKWVLAVADPFGHGAGAVALFQALLVVGAYYPMERLCRKITGNGIASALISGALLFWSAVFLPGLMPEYYRLGLVTQPWHNITYLGMRLFAAVVMCRFFDIFPHYEKRFTVADWLWLAIPLALSTIVKPNYLLAFAGTLALALAIRVVSGKFAAGRLIGAVKLGTTILPSLVVLFLQSRILYGVATETESPHGVAFLVVSWFFSEGFWPAALRLARAFGFALLVLGVHCGKGGIRLAPGEKFLYLQAAVGLFIALHFIETGPRMTHGNFGWTTFATGYLLYGAVFARFARDALDCFRGVRRQSPWYLAAGGILALGHVISGISYFALLFKGPGYMY